MAVSPQELFHINQRGVYVIKKPRAQRSEQSGWKSRRRWVWVASSQSWLLSTALVDLSRGALITGDGSRRVQLHLGHIPG